MPNPSIFPLILLDFGLIFFLFQGKIEPWRRLAETAAGRFVMGLSIKINDVPVRVVRRSSGYFFRWPDMLLAAGLRDGLWSGAVGMYEYRGHAIRRYPSGPLYVDVPGCRDYIARMREAIDTGGWPEPWLVGIEADLDRLEACAAECGAWAESCRISGWRSVRPVEGDTDWGVVVNGSLVRVARNGRGTWFFQPVGLLRAAGVPVDKSAEVIEAQKPVGHAVEDFLPGTAMSVWFVDLVGFRDYAARQRKAAQARVDGACMDGALGEADIEKAVTSLDDTEAAMCRLEDCIAACEAWVASHGKPALGNGGLPQVKEGDAAEEPGAVPCADDPFRPDVDEPVFDEFDKKLDGILAGIKKEMDTVPGRLWEEEGDGNGPGPGLSADAPAGTGEVTGEDQESGDCSARRSMVPGGSGAGLMVKALLERLPLLCMVFGISPDLGREEQLAWIIWLLLFRDETVDDPDKGTADASFLWRGRDWCSVSRLVGAAMTE